MIRIDIVIGSHAYQIGSNRITYLAQLIFQTGNFCIPESHEPSRPLDSQEKNTLKEKDTLNLSLASNAWLTTTTRLPPLLIDYIASCSCCCYTMVVACQGGPASPIACLDRTRVVDDLVVVLVLWWLQQAVAVCGVRIAAIAVHGPYIPIYDDTSCTSGYIAACRVPYRAIYGLYRRQLTIYRCSRRLYMPKQCLKQA